MAMVGHATLPAARPRRARAAQWTTFSSAEVKAVGSEKEGGENTSALPPEGPSSLRLQAAKAACGQ